jgi:phthiocerol/phenolphthiocerol synthesis type-I polyketide synthase E
VHRFRVQGRPAGGQEWADHCSGTLTVAADAGGTHLAGIRERLAASPLENPGLADWIDFGPRWHTTVTTWGVPGERLAHLRLPDRFHHDFATHPMHPAILDVATGVLADNEPGKSYAPFLYRRISVYGPLGPDILVHARTNGGDRRPWPLDLDIYDHDSEQLLVRVEGFTLREVAPGQFTTDQATTTSSPPSQSQPAPAGLLRPSEGAEAFLALVTAGPPAVVMVEPAGTSLLAAGMPWIDDDRQAVVTPSVQPDPVTAAPPPRAATPSQVPQVDSDDLVDWLRGLWTSTLGITDIGPDTDFFEVGGNSLAAVQLIGQIRDDRGVELDVGEIFELTTIRLMADRLRG